MIHNLYFGYLALIIFYTFLLIVNFLIVDKDSILYNILYLIIIILAVAGYYLSKFIEKKIKNKEDFINYINLDEEKSSFIIFCGQAVQGTTGLIWQRFASGEKWHDWLNFSSASPTSMNFEEALAIQSNYANADNWRLPTIDELKSLLKINTLFEIKVGLQIDTSVFCSTPADFFWSSTLSSDNSKIQGICFKKGTIVEKNKNEKGYVRLVRDRSIELQQTKIKEENKYEHFEKFNSQALQKSKNLVWARCAIGQKWRDWLDFDTGNAELMTFENALTVNNDYLNTDDWRLPSIDELKSLVKYSDIFDAQISSSIFPNTPANFFWSSTFSGDGSKIKGICFKKGIVVEKDRNDKGYVRLVREQASETEMEITTSFYKSHSYLLMCFFIFIIIFSVPNYFTTYNLDNIAVFFSDIIKSLDKETQNVKNKFTTSLVKNHAPTGSIVINGKEKIGNVLTIENTLTDSDKLGDFSYQWFSNNKEIPNATNKTYTLVESDIGKKITVNVSYLDGEGNNEEITSYPTNFISSAISTEPTNGNDVLTGTDKKDALNGLEGNDTIIGSLESDILTGGSGADLFQFNSIQDSGINSDSRDVITDFNHNEKDKLDFTAITKKIPLHFIGNQPFSKTNATGEIRFDTTNHILYVSTNIDNKPEFSIDFKDTKNLVNDDFIFQNNSSK